MREALNVEPADCRLAEKTGKLKINGKEQKVQIGVSMSFHTYLKGGVDINNNCEVGTFEYGGKEYTKQVVLASYEVLLRQEWARANDISGMITMASGIIARTTDRSIMDSAEGTYVWSHSEESCPDTIVKLYSGPIKVLTNTSATFNGGLAIVEGRDKNQVAGLELTETFLLCGRAAQKTHIRNIVVFFHPMSQIQVASGKFDAATTEASITRLESELSFLQVKATMTLQERIRQVKGDICENRRQIAQLRLESIAGAENPYSLIQIFGRGHQVTRNGATVYVTRCQPVEVTPRMHANCTSEIPVTVNNTNLFVDPISFVIKAAASPVRCNDIAPPRWKLGGKWYCAFPQIRDCGEPGQIPMTPLKTQDVQVLGMGLGKSIYSPEQIDEFIRFQESQGTRRAFLAESAERAYNSRFGGEWGSGLTDLATDHLVDVVGFHLVPLYRLLGPTAMIAILILFLVGIVRMMLDIVVRAIAIARVRGCGLWLLGALWGTLFQVAVSPVRWAAGVGHDAGQRVRYQMDAEVARIEGEDKVESDYKSTLEIEGETPARPSGGTISNLDRLVDWSNQWTRRNHAPRPYPASSAPQDEESVPVFAEAQEAEQRRRNLN
jgi:hypothetical protein